jgi:hypothetical protein
MVIFCLERKGAYGRFTVCQGQAASGFAKNLPLSRALFLFFLVAGERICLQKP